MFVLKKIKSHHHKFVIILNNNKKKIAPLYCLFGYNIANFKYSILNNTLMLSLPKFFRLNRRKTLLITWIVCEISMQIFFYYHLYSAHNTPYSISFTKTCLIETSFIKWCYPYCVRCILIYLSVFQMLLSLNWFKTH